MFRCQFQCQFDATKCKQTLTQFLNELSRQDPQRLLSWSQKMYTFDMSQFLYYSSSTPSDTCLCHLYFLFLDCVPFPMRVYENLILVTATGREVVMSNYKTVQSFYHFILCCCPSVLSHPPTIYKSQNVIMHFNSFVIRYVASGNVH